MGSEGWEGLWSLRGAGLGCVEGFRGAGQRATAAGHAGAGAGGHAMRCWVALTEHDAVAGALEMV